MLDDIKFWLVYGPLVSCSWLIDCIFSEENQDKIYDTVINYLNQNHEV